MNKETILELQKAFEDILLIAELEKALSYKENLLNAKEKLLAEAECQSDTCNESDELLTPIDDCITTFLNKCTTEQRVPTLEEAQSICILDYINSKYN